MPSLIKLIHSLENEVDSVGGSVQRYDIFGDAVSEDD